MYVCQRTTLGTSALLVLFVEAEFFLHTAMLRAPGEPALRFQADFLSLPLSHCGVLRSQIRRRQSDFPYKHSYSLSPLLSPA